MAATPTSTQQSAFGTALPAPVFGVRNDGGAGASSASDLLMTIFGELMRPNGGAAWTQTLVTTLEVVGVEEKAARQAISRLAGKGWLASERVGRRSRWHLTPWATTVLERGAERIYGFGARTNQWDGTWLVLLASIPEAQRAVRASVAVRLGWAGFGSIGQGVWVCPRVEREPEAAQVLADFGVTGATLFRSEMTETGDPVDLAGRAWQPDDLADDYAAFLATSVALRPDTDSETVGALIRLVDAWRRFPLLDPDLPPELLADDWPGTTAAAEFIGRRAAWSPIASAWWKSADAAFD